VLPGQSSSLDDLEDYAADRLEGWLDTQPGWVRPAVYIGLAGLSLAAPAIVGRVGGRLLGRVLGRGVLRGIVRGAGRGANRQIARNLARRGLNQGVQAIERNAARVASRVRPGAPPRGGVYEFFDPLEGKVARVGQTGQTFKNRWRPYARDARYNGLIPREKYAGGTYSERRGLEQRLYDHYTDEYGHPPRLNVHRPIDPKNRNRDQYLRDADEYLDRQP
jgi:hypothetical protein